MVFDTLANAGAYASLGPGISAALRFLRGVDRLTIAPGRHAIDGDRVFALVSEYDTRPLDEVPWEAHRAHVDVQWAATGEECIAYANLDDLRVGAYDGDRDLVTASGAPALLLPISGDVFVVLMPQDAHKPGVVRGGVGRVKKIVVKVGIA